MWHGLVPIHLLVPSHGLVAKLIFFMSMFTTDAETNFARKCFYKVGWFHCVDIVPHTFL